MQLIRKMKLNYAIKYITFFFCLVPMVGFSQEYIAPLLYNPQVFDGKPTVNQISKNTFDSTFIYRTDTLKVTLSDQILDDFSTDKFQHYSNDFSDPTVTSEKYYRLKKKDGITVYSAATRFHNQITVKRTYNPAENTLDISPLPADTILYSTLSVYPPVYEQRVVYPPYDLYDTIGSSHPADTSFLDFVYYTQDSATQFFAYSQDPLSIWLDKDVFHNYTMAKDPWTLGVATFDGLDKNGFPYLINSTANGIADKLTSKPIDMSALSPTNEVYLSFLYQTAGFGDEPEQEDSLILQFYSPIQNQWYHVWSADGTPTGDFKKVHIKIDNPVFFGNGFQMRFMNFGRLAGNLDNFHLDYVFLRSGSGAADTLFKDFAFVYPIQTLLKDYTSVPWDHYKESPENRMSDSVRVVVRNGSNVAENSQSGTAWVSQNGTTEGSFVLSDYELTAHDPATNYAPRTTFYSYHDFSNGYRFDENTSGDKQLFDIKATATVPFSQLTINDTTFGQQFFSNYYAYDDGTAEQAYGINGAQAMLAYQFTPYEADSVIGVSMCFVPTVEDVTDKLFLVTIWNDANGQPGEKIYEDDFFFPRNPKYGFGHDAFINYYLTDTAKIPVSGKFYIGWRQLDDAKLCVGLDRNTNSKEKIFYSINNGATWINTVYDASLMIRPIFSTALDATLGIAKEPIKEHFDFVVYPNPTTGWLHIQTNQPNYQGASIYAISGKLVTTLSENEEEVDLSHLVQGIYFIKDIQTGTTVKFIKQ